MTAQADLIRDRRRAFAAPGGFHDRLITILSKALPAAIGLVAAVMILSPLSPRGEVGFLLDRNKVAITSERIAVDKAMYRGQDGRGRPFVVKAGSAIQATSANPTVILHKLEAHLEMTEGPARIWAPQGNYNYRSEQITVDGPVNFEAADGYRMVTQNVAIDLNEHKAVGSGGVSGSVSTGTFAADSIIADLDARTVTLEGNARLLMTPGKLRIPK
ncbi:MAG: LPS export ABC transporter periplasmic protein LptC [Sphingomonadaceae bacterium]|nr:LPS export ABC transporter periplasmic protein LptC [Sphingomonadaceae bacterium]